MPRTKEGKATKRSEVVGDDAIAATDVSLVSDFIIRFDEAARKRLDAMNQKLRDLEMHMEALEDHVSKADSSFNKQI
ncbi:hypothetical protein QJS04_geneDACA000875 [Acorus gramineus]|uniref:Uncharacterized protein n=1 Tax=Acorus gramineus TaxID=55184 RepID=A0AAV9BGL8_ACOGR|nr:hypothetical protein QJS04_geneDACA000875 [Acorus gramineus]